MADAPSGKTAPDAAEHDVSTEPDTVSAAAEVKLTGAPPRTLPSMRTSPAGKPTSGAVVSTTERVKEPNARFPAASVAWHVTSWVPSATTAPEGIEHRTGTTPLTPSTAAVVYWTGAPCGPTA